MERFYKLSEKDFVTGEFDELFCEYNGYRIEISYSEKYKMWACDAFDLKAEEYVFYPVLRFLDEDKTKFNDIIQLAAKYIKEKVKSKERGNEDILIYIRDKDNYDPPYDYLDIED